jgi:hypothetical protein
MQVIKNAVTGDITNHKEKESDEGCSTYKVHL